MLRNNRLFVALIFIPIFYIIIRHFSPFVFFLLVSGSILIGQYEFYKFYYKESVFPQIILGLSLGFFISLSFYMRDHFSQGAVITTMIVTIMIYQVFFKKEVKDGLLDSAIILFGVIYIGWLMSHLILLRNSINGGLLIIFLFLVTWGCDAGAYYVGTYIGRTKLSPEISPNKTIEGTIGGLTVSIILALTGKAWFLHSLSGRDALTLGIFLGTLGQLGDLAESLLKRSAGVKDSSSLIPAHGGLLDKVDSLLFTAPALYYYLLFREYTGSIIV